MRSNESSDSEVPRLKSSANLPDSLCRAIVYDKVRKDYTHKDDGKWIWNMPDNTTDGIFFVDTYFPESLPIHISSCTRKDHTTIQIRATFTQEMTCQRIDQLQGSELGSYNIEQNLSFEMSVEDIEYGYDVCIASQECKKPSAIVLNGILSEHTHIKNKERRWNSPPKEQIPEGYTSEMPTAVDPDRIIYRTINTREAENGAVEVYVVFFHDCVFHKEGSIPFVKPIRHEVVIEIPSSMRSKIFADDEDVLHGPVKEISKAKIAKRCAVFCILIGSLLAANVVKKKILKEREAIHEVIPTEIEPYRLGINETKPNTLNRK